MLAALYRLWGTKLAGIAGLIVAFLVANPETTQGLLDLFPEGAWRTVASAGVGLIVFITATGAQAADVRQAKKPEQP